jgi:hypothetical protein
MVMVMVAHGDIMVKVKLRDVDYRKRGKIVEHLLMLKMSLE